MVRNQLRKLIFDDGKNEKYFYGKYQGGKKLSIIKKILMVFLDLRSLKDFFLYHSNLLIVNTFGKAKKNGKPAFTVKEQEILKVLKDDGIVFLDGYFENIVEQLLVDNVEQCHSAKDGYAWKDEVEQNDALYGILNDESLIKIASEYYGVKAFYRYRPHVNVTFPRDHGMDSREIFSTTKNTTFADEWHVDSIYNLQYHILLEDVSDDQTRMLFAQGDRVGFFDRFSAYASEEYVRNNFLL